jgi:integrase
VSAAAAVTAAALTTGVSHVFTAGLGADRRAAGITALIQPEFVAAAGWDPASLVLAPPPEHPLLGWPICRTSGCGNAACRCEGLCRACARGRPAATSVAAPSSVAQVGDPGMCAVAGCARAWRSSRQPLCRAHLRQRDDLGLSLSEFLTHPGIRPLREYGPCQVRACLRERTGGRSPYCAAHAMRLRKRRVVEPDLDEQRWRRRESPVFEAGLVSLRGLPHLVVAELLFGLQQRTYHGSKTRPADLARVCDAARRAGVTSLVDLPQPRCAQDQHLLRALIRHVRLTAADANTEQNKDTWDLAVLGHGGTLVFTEITQPWLREAAKAWAANDLPRRRARRVAGITQGRINALTRLSTSLRLARDDHGNIPAQLTRHDIETFLNRLAFLDHRGDITTATRIRTCQHVKNLLTEFRHLGLTRPGRVAAGLPGDVALARRDIPAQPESPEPGRDLPAEVIGQLTAQLTALEDISSPELRLAVELLMDTGRRPEEICSLPLDCLTHDSTNAPVLIYQNVKAHRPGRRLPITTTTAQLIRNQQTRVKTRYPATQTPQLALLPTGRVNPHGTRPISAVTLSSRHRDWVNSLPPLLAADGAEFTKTRIVPYAYRHSFAQRHADAGVPIDVLRDLMDHTDLDVTRGYYRVGEDRRRAALDTVTALSFDRHGNRIWRDARTLLDSERARSAVGEIAVPYGNCTEPSNVQAGGGACPIRFRCAGCDHFQTTIAHLPDLQAHLDDLLRTRERLAATITGIDEWARADATPTEEEITRIRRLINRIKSDIAGLGEAQQTQIDDAVAVVRRHRAAYTVSLGMPTTRATAAAPLATTTSKGIT